MAVTIQQKNLQRGLSGKLNAKPTTSSWLKTGYHFIGWNTKSDGTGTSYEDEQEVTLQNDLYLYARWIANTYSINYALNSGTHGTTHPTSATYDLAFYVSAPTRTGYTFTGWTVSSGLNASTAKWGTTSSTDNTISSNSTKCLGTSASSNVYFKNITATHQGSVTLSANWSNSVYTVTLNANGGTINSGNVTSYTYGTGATLPTNVTAPNTGYKFDGWYANAELTGSKVTAISTTDTGSKTFWTKYVEDYVTITFNSNN